MSRTKVIFHTGHSDIDMEFPDGAVTQHEGVIRIDMSKFPGNLTEPFQLHLMRTIATLGQADKDRRRNTLSRILEASLEMLKTQVMRRFEDNERPDPEPR